MGTKLDHKPERTGDLCADQPHPKYPGDTSMAWVML